MMSEDKSILIKRLAIDSENLFSIPASISRTVSEKFVHDNKSLVNDPLVNHGNLDSYVERMLLEYKILTKDQIRRKIISSLKKA